ncbi:TetR/AcrR family transcriptional regulator [Epilithonimonas hungarica]|uniref:Transcriptional regulator, TetR family n=1 Tax=Epilithonimonas hungarica TaxID=454006 RepID=A0A1G7SCI0_9FLAO|nr:TetR/AcrR family transcriptional regulator [Epilithonimonas hungarica]SDG20624.1 transcriptional regulator, TetR family [Epilithonimonas hungarica]
MTKKESLVYAAMELFAENGFEKTSTANIAKRAQVSEALIFKHFTNKDGLLDAVLKQGYADVLKSNKNMLESKDPLSFVHRVIELPYVLYLKHPLFWKMQAQLQTHPKANHAQEHFVKPVKSILANSLRNLGYSNPDKESELILTVVDSVWKKLAVDDNFNIGAKDLIKYIQDKYTIEIKQENK